MSESNKQTPFRSLGEELKALRSKRKETLVEVSGAVEIDPDVLSNFEQGSVRPSEDILMLLISYFDVEESRATKLWKLAGYESIDQNNSQVSLDDVSATPPQIVVVPMDARIVYTDMVHVSVNNYGVVINFMQTAGANNQPLAVSRIGMSKEHAYSLLEVLKNTLEQADKPKEIKQIPSSSKKTTTDEKQAS